MREKYNILEQFGRNSSTVFFVHFFKQMGFLEFHLNEDICKF